MEILLFVGSKPTRHTRSDNRKPTWGGGGGGGGTKCHFLSIELNSIRPGGPFHRIVTKTSHNSARGWGWESRGGI